MSISFLGDRTAVGVRNAAGTSPAVLICEHASNYIPDHLGNLGVDVCRLTEHIAWDPGALGVAEHLSDLLDAPLVYANISRLVLDINRAPTHEGSIVQNSDDVAVPGNVGLSALQRKLRVEAIYDPFHAAVDAAMKSRGETPCAISIHSFTPKLRNVHRPWHVGVLHNDDARLAEAIRRGLDTDPELIVGDNQPYSPADGVYHTIERHTAEKKYPGAMLEIRNDLIARALDQEAWASRLSRVLVPAISVSS